MVQPFDPQNLIRRQVSLTPSVSPLKHTVISTAQNQKNRGIGNSTSCTVIGQDLRTGLPFSKGFPTYAAAEQWIATSSDNFNVERISSGGF
jgi:hypothetical protein